LKLLQLADSALPIGAAAHSFGIETLVADRAVSTDNLDSFLRSYLEESGKLDCAFLAGAYRMDFSADEWIRLNSFASARKLARESRSACSTLGRRFLRLANDLDPSAGFEAALLATPEVHLAPAFGLAARRSDIPVEHAVPAFLQQSTISMVSACQRLMPLGQTEASRLVWSLRSAILRIAAEGIALDPLEASSFTPLVEIASMRHPGLETRLFVS
jgi:urease accessory protein